MKLLIATFMLFTVCAMAGDNYLAVACRTDAPAADKAALVKAIRSMLQDTRELTAGDLRTYTAGSNSWHVIMVHRSQARSMTPEKIAAWKAWKLSQPEKVQAVWIDGAWELKDYGLMEAQ